MGTKDTPKQIDAKKWEAAANFVRVSGRFRQLLRTRNATDPELKEAAVEYEKALRRFKRMQKV